ncbi:protein of unknown function [Candidatus Hydrogenisulfobacillus filiaventi]|uniref:Uncharacterized protein n=1 Tax=Candidatus Hydrogenisulfobacillus filiaventi TaxID=2707344 RepID=A0A6F8ZF39_9FIRM|nr:protein of unknown function [Candidatus Hydrogenisulfobacillus filiaventi]
MQRADLLIALSPSTTTCYKMILYYIRVLVPFPLVPSGAGARMLGPGKALLPRFVVFPVYAEAEPVTGNSSLSTMIAWNPGLARMVIWNRLPISSILEPSHGSPAHFHNTQSYWCFTSRFWTFLLWDGTNLLSRGRERPTNARKYFPLIRAATALQSTGPHPGKQGFLPLWLHDRRILR